MNELKDQLELEIKDELESRRERTKRTLDLWSKLQDKMEQILTAEKPPSASMLTAISNTLANQIKLDKQGLESIVKQFNREEEKNENEGNNDFEGTEDTADNDVTNDVFQLPFPTNTDESVTPYQGSDVAKKQSQGLVRPPQDDFLKPIELL